MKKIIIIISIISLFFINKVFSYTPKSSDNITINKLVNIINKKYSNKSISKKNELKNILYSTINQNKKDEKLVYILNESLKKLNLYEYKKEYTDHYKDYNLDIYTIKNKWINWHNIERNKLGVSIMTNDQRLDNTAYEWSKYQSSISTMTHERTSGDGFYNYDIIEKWFQDRLVKCKIAGGSTSSESIAQYGYYCSDLDCNQELIESLQIIFDIYMNEKGLSYPDNAHYKSIIHENLKNIGMGLYITNTNEDNYYEYYLTTHYCTEFTN